MASTMQVKTVVKGLCMMAKLRHLDQARFGLKWFSDTGIVDEAEFPVGDEKGRCFLGAQELKDSICSDAKAEW